MGTFEFLFIATAIVAFAAFAATVVWVDRRTNG